MILQPIIWFYSTWLNCWTQRYAVYTTKWNFNIRSSMGNSSVSKYRTSL